MFITTVVIAVVLAPAFLAAGTAKLAAAQLSVAVRSPRWWPGEVPGFGHVEVTEVMDEEENGGAKPPPCSPCRVKP